MGHLSNVDAIYDEHYGSAATSLDSADETEGMLGVADRHHVRIEVKQAVKRSTPTVGYDLSSGYDYVDIRTSIS